MSFLSVKNLDNLERMTGQELRDAEFAVTFGVQEAAEDLLFDLRSDVLTGGLGSRLANSWRVAHYPRGGKSLGAASVVKTKAPKLIRAFDEGAVIKSSDGFWLAIPTEAAPKRGRGRKRINPSNFPEHAYGPLKFIYNKKRPNMAYLVVENQVERRGKRKGFRLTKSKRALKTGRGLTTVIMFILVPQVKLKRRLNVEPIKARAPGNMLRQIDRGFRQADRMRGKK